MSLSSEKYLLTDLGKENPEIMNYTKNICICCTRLNCIKCQLEKKKTLPKYPCNTWEAIMSEYKTTISNFNDQALTTNIPLPFRVH